MRVIPALVPLLCKLIIHMGYVTHPTLTRTDTLRLCQRQQVTTREEEGLLKKSTLHCTLGVSQLLSYCMLHHTLLYQLQQKSIH